MNRSRTNRRWTARLLTGLVVLLSIPSTLHAAVFQFRVLVETGKGERHAYLWVPPEAARVHGVVVGGMTLAERELASDPRIRAACAEAGLAIVFLDCGLRAADVPVVLRDLAKASGYGELAVAPLVFFGHSAGGPQALEEAKRMPGRTIAIVQYRGGSPVMRDEPLPPGVPSLMMIGQFDEFGKIGRDTDGIENWEKDRDQMADYRAAKERNVGAVVVEPGAGHFAWSARNAAYLALYLQKAAAARIPKKWPLDAREPVTCVEIEPASGWLTDLDFEEDEPAAPAQYAKYAGERTRAAWHFDEELARATIAYHEGLGREDQFLEWRDPHHVSAGARFFHDRVTWVDDGRTFEVHPAYSKTYPWQYGGRGAVWGRAGQPVRHADVPIRTRHVSGPFERVGEHRFRTRFDELAPATKRARFAFLAYSEGDERFRYTERIGLVDPKLLERTEGRAQAISFPALPPLPANGAGVPLRATSDSGLPVEYHVAYGPARIRDGRLEPFGVPRRATFPIPVGVVAYQLGRPVEPRVQSAEPVAVETTVTRPE